MESSNSKYFSRLDHLRLLAALMVLFWHVLRYSKQAPTNEVPSFWPLSFAQEGHTGVSLFMCLSGFIFWTLCKNRQINYLKFIRNRTLRIAPLFVVWTLLYFYTSEIDPTKLFVAIVGLLNKGTVPGVGWTIIVEFQFYLIFPFLLFFTQSYGLRYLWAIVILAIFLRWSVWHATGTVQDLAYSTIFGRIDQFVLGMISGELATRYKQLFHSRALPIALMLIGSALMHWFDSAGGFFDNGGYPSNSSIWIYWPSIEGCLFSLIIASYLGIPILLPKSVDKVLAKLGTLSYSLYLNQHFAILLSHGLAKQIGIDTTGFWNALGFTFFGVFPLLVAMSMMTYYAIERPFLLLRTPYLKS